MASRIPLPEQLEVVERLLERAKVEQDWPTIAPLRLVKKLRGARQRKRQATGKKVEGRKSLAEMYPEAVKTARRLRRASPKTGERLSFREISVRLAEAGHLNEHGQPFNAQSVAILRVRC